MLAEGKAAEMGGMISVWRRCRDRKGHVLLLIFGTLWEIVISASPGLLVNFLHGTWHTHSVLLLEEELHQHFVRVSFIPEKRTSQGPIGKCKKENPFVLFSQFCSRPVMFSVLKKELIRQVFLFQSQPNNQLIPKLFSCFFMHKMQLVSFLFPQSLFKTTLQPFM